jgi:hypothetical protein
MMILLVVSLACTPRRGRDRDDDACDLADPQCTEGRVCEAVQDADPQCLAPLVIRGTVVTVTEGAFVEGARVQAVDANGAAVGTSAVSASDGSYELTVPALRDVEGNPIEGSYTLRAQAAGFQEFPTPIRPALPLDATTATVVNDDWVIENALTTLALIALPGDVSSLGSLAGTIDADAHAGVLVIAESGAASYTGFSDSEGEYVIFNVPAGAYLVRGYQAGIQVGSTSATLDAGDALTAVDLAQTNQPLSTISGNVQIVNAPGGSITSIVLAVESTFVESVARGAVPPGLRVGDVSGAFTISDVPDGRYVVLAAFENDGLVRDPDQNIGGTKIVHIETPDPASGNSVVLPEGFKVTGALAVVSPGANAPEQAATPTPTFEWQDDSSEDGYEIRVYDAFGVQVWSDEIGPVTGSATVSHTYAGEALTPGMFYQFRATSFRERSGGRNYISATEDLRGVFFFLVP